ncbi:MAG: TIGR04282 family arsenosugar biosynthesis glycosyltransferase [Flavobacteriales bacterium]|nr:TIGR04282 family arsenosugar biosynthesis glycosyltransferase [Flavobacteriales bacterium]
MNDMHLIIFIKNPVLGKVKTRLAAGIGEQRALEIYMQLLEITRSVALKINCTRNVFYSDEIVSDDWEDDKFNKFVQEGDDLGERMKNAFEQVFALGAKNAVIIGSDCPELTSNIIAEAFELLDNRDVTIGPANDGGYYLLGMKKLHPFLFEEKEWSTDSVFEDTVIDLSENQLSYGCLEKLSDLDTVSDLYLLDVL